MVAMLFMLSNHNGMVNVCYKIEVVSLKLVEERVLNYECGLMMDDDATTHNNAIKYK